MILLSIILPMSLLAALRLTGVLHEPLTPETVVVEAVAWNMSRPSGHVVFEEEVKNSYASNVASIGLEVPATQYLEDTYLVDGRDLLWIRIVATANVSAGFIHSMVVRFSRTDDYAVLHVDPTPDFIKLENLRIGGICEPSTNKSEAYFEAKGINQPKNCSLNVLAWWVFFDENTVDHGVTVTLEATYFNGTALQKVVIPIELGVMTP